MHEPDETAELDPRELAELRSLVERASLRDVEWEAPPPSVWNRITAELATGERRVTPLPAEPAPLRSRRRWLMAGAGVAAAAAAAAVAAVVVVDDGDPDTEVVSAVELDTLAGSASGRAELIRVDGAVQLRLETAGLGTADGYFEVWLLNPAVTELVSLGPLRADGEYDVPGGVDPAAFPIVDVSVEPVDGDPAHSGNSVLRGELST